jgi:hypothetical protein
MGRRPYLALFSEPQDAVDRRRRRDPDQGIDTIAAARNAATAAVKDHMPLVRGAQRFGQSFLRLMHGDARRAQPGLLAAVGIADQHTLPAVARLEVGPIDAAMTWPLARSASMESNIGATSSGTAPVPASSMPAQRANNSGARTSSEPDVALTT